MKYPPSILTDDLTSCHFCGRQAEVHHVIHGSYRDKSTKYGLVIGLCPAHHRTSKLSAHLNAEVDRKLKIMAQRKFIEIHGEELWFKEFGKNYEV